MEPLSRRFRPLPSRVLFPAFVLVLAEMFLGALLPFESTALGGAVVAAMVTTVAGAVGAQGTILRLEADDDRFITTVSLFGIRLVRREAVGVSWYLIVRPLRSLDTSAGDKPLCRIEVANAEGDRRVVLGEVLAFVYGVECL